MARTNQLITNKRQQLSRYAADLAIEMERFSKAVLAGDGDTRDCPIQYNATYINTLCGELNALVEARRMMQAIKPPVGNGAV